MSPGNRFFDRLADRWKAWRTGFCMDCGEPSAKCVCGIVDPKSLDTLVDREGPYRTPDRPREVNRCCGYSVIYAKRLEDNHWYVYCPRCDKVGTLIGPEQSLVATIEKMKTSRRIDDDPPLPPPTSMPSGGMGRKLGFLSTGDMVGFFIALTLTAGVFYFIFHGGRL